MATKMQTHGATDAAKAAMRQPSTLQPPVSSRPLGQFDALVGEWTMVGSHPAFPTAPRGSSLFEWLVEGCLLLWRFDWQQPGPPSAISPIGRDDSDDVCSMLYADERGVVRVYRMSLQDGVWKMWREAPGFSQRMTGTF